MVDEKLTVKEQWYDVKKYKDEIRQFVLARRTALNQTAKMEQTFKRLYRAAYAGTEEADTERFPHTAEIFKVYKAALIEACLQGYSALDVITGLDAYSTMKVPELQRTMTQQFKSMSLIECLSQDTVDDWILKGEAAGFVKLKETREEYRIKQTVVDEETGEELIKFNLIEGVNYEDLEFERIDPLDLYIDAYDYRRDPLGCPKIVRSFISTQNLLTSDAYPMMSMEEKKDLASKFAMRDTGFQNFWTRQYIGESESYAKTGEDQIEVLTFRGDYVTTDGKVLKNIICVVVGGHVADLKYSEVSTNRLIYAAYKVDRQTHRGVSPLASSNPINKLMNRAVDMFLKNLEDISVPTILFEKGAINQTQWDNYKKEKKLEYMPQIVSPPQFWAPPPAATSGLDLLNIIINQNKNMLGLNSYMAGDSSGAVRTAEESAILFQKANARMRVETDVFSYNFMLRLINSFYTFNRELALAAGHALAPIYADPDLRVSISTNASRADEQGELNMLMQILNLPIAQMIFSNLTPQQTILAVRYLMSKSGIKDTDNLLELIDQDGNTTQMLPTDRDGNILAENSGGMPPMNSQEVPMDIPPELPPQDMM